MATTHNAAIPHPIATATGTETDEKPFNTRMLSSMIPASNDSTAEHIPRTRPTLPTTFKARLPMAQPPT